MKEAIGSFYLLWIMAIKSNSANGYMCNRWCNQTVTLRQLNNAAFICSSSSWSCTHWAALASIDTNCMCWWSTENRIEIHVRYLKIQVDSLGELEGISNTLNRCYAKHDFIRYLLSLTFWYFLFGLASFSFNSNPTAAPWPAAWLLHDVACR